jgi:hypothetical protein
MAKSTATSTSKTVAKKEPGRFAQLWRYYRMTAKQSPKSVLWAAGFALVGFGIVFAIGLVSSAGSTLSIVIWSVTAAFVAILTGMIVMNKQSEKVAFAQIEGRAGAVGAILQNGLKRGWRAAETPAAISAGTQEAVYRVVGPGGVVLIGEGTSRSRVSAMVESEKKKVAKVATGVPVHTLFVVGDDKSVKLIKLINTIYGHKRALNRTEVSVVYKRLDTVGLKLPIPKGIDPNRMRASRR